MLNLICPNFIHFGKNSTVSFIFQNGEISQNKLCSRKKKKVGSKLNIQKTKIMASGPITSWEVDGETVSDYFSGL